MSRERDRFDEIGKRIKRETDIGNTPPQIATQPPPSPGGGGGGGGRLVRQNVTVGAGTGTGTVLNTVTPCAACKLLRRRCAQECPFSPYFSPFEPHKFASVHKVFGASNVSKMLLEVPESQRADAANSLVYEANIRLRDPVYGCMGAISALQHQVQVLQTELNFIRAEILKYKYREPSSILPPLLPASGTISIALPPPPSTATAQSSSPPSPPSLPPVSCISSSSMYTRGPGTPDHYNTMSSDNVSYFG